MRISTIAALAASAALCAPAQAQDRNWAQAAERDVEFAYRTYVDNHPGWLDPTNPGFRDQLDAARKAGLAIAATARDANDHGAALTAFSNILADGHARVWSTAKAMPQGEATPSLLWPGFVMGWRGHEARVVEVETGLRIERGARVIGCDDTPIKAWIRDKSSAIGMIPSRPGSWWDRTPNLLVQYDNVPRLAEHCTFVGADGARREVALDWRTAPDDLFARLNRAREGDRLPVGLTEPAPGIHWIALPDFNPEGETIERYAQLDRDLAARHASLAGARAVVLDLRHNDGGSSTWPTAVAGRLWGDDAVERRIADYQSDIEIWYRASEGNLAYLDEARTAYADRPAIAAAIGPMYEGVAGARARGEDFWVNVVGDDATMAAVADKSPASDFSTPVYVIVPGGCASACLDALDIFTLFDNVTLVGAPSSSDTTYMEIRREALPSGVGQMVIPIKTWYRRPRESGEAYYPAIRHDGLDWSTEAFLALVEEQLD